MTDHTVVGFPLKSTRRLQVRVSSVEVEVNRIVAMGSAFLGRPVIPRDRGNIHRINCNHKMQNKLGT
jgi:hypothetical protein